MKKILVMLSAAVLVFASCAKDEVIAPSGIAVDKNTVELFPGEEADVTALISPANATSNYVTWTSSDTKVAAVTGHGQVVAIAPNAKEIGNGEATITATTADGKYSATCKVIVKPFRVSDFDVKADKTTVAEYDEITWTPVFTPANASYQDVKWTSSDETIAKVSDGVVTGVKAGKATITAVSKDGEIKVETVVDVTASTNLNLWVDNKAGEASLDAGEGKADAGWLKYEDGKVTWEENKSGSPRFATVRVYDKDKKLLGAAAVTQVEETDFAGSWTLVSQLFDPHKSIGKGSNVKDETVVEFVNLDAATDNGNNILIAGLYKTAEVEGKVVVDYTAKTVKFGVFVSNFTIYNSGKGSYCALLPECADKGGTWGGYNFIPKEDGKFSDTNCDWLWFPYDVEKATATYKFYKDNGGPQISPNGAWGYCGLSFCVASKTEITGTDYDVIYQANWNKDNAVGMYFKK